MSAVLRCTKDYSLFDSSLENRQVNLEAHRILKKSLMTHGWVRAYPMHVTRGPRGRLVIVDGQHRFELAKSLRLQVWFVETENHVDVALINNSQKPWTGADYAGSFAQRGNGNYQKALDFSREHGVPIMAAVTML